MKIKSIFPILALVAVIFASCKKQTDEQVQNNNAPVLNAGIKDPAIAQANPVPLNQIMAQNHARLSKLIITSSMVNNQSITVPGDYATIQGAIDAAGSGANIFVDAGTYNEAIVVSTPGLNIQARNNVLLNGGFLLAAGADNVKIQKFKIDATSSYALSGNTWQGGIVAMGVSGGQIIQNTITGSSESGIRGTSIRNMTIRDNHISGVDWGLVIFSDQTFATGVCSNNTVLNNTITATNTAGIQLQGKCINNSISNNQINNLFEFANPGITIYSVPDYIGLSAEYVGDCKNNVVKNNVSNNSGVGMGVFFVSFANTFGPGNTVNANMYYGMYIYGSSICNVFNNTVTANGICDIVVENSSNNIFKKNTAGCVSGF